MASTPHVNLSLQVDTIDYQLRLMAASLHSDPAMAAVLTAAADARRAGDHGPLVTAVVAFADGLWAETQAAVQEASRGSQSEPARARHQVNAPGRMDPEWPDGQPRDSELIEAQRGPQAAAGPGNGAKGHGT